MLTQLKKKQSMTSCLQNTSLSQKDYAEKTVGLTNVLVTDVTRDTTILTTNYNTQLNRYIENSNQVRRLLNRQASDHISGVHQQNDIPTTTLIRDKRSWKAVKTQVVREELQKLQITGKTDLPLTKEELQLLKELIKGKDLTIDVDTIERLTETIARGNDKEIARIFDKIISQKTQNPQEFLNAFRLLKEKGKISSCIQKDKAGELQKELEKLDLSKLTKKEFDHLVNRYCEKNEFHHRKSVKSDPTKQNDPDNIEVVKTSKHKEKHTDTDTGKVDYKKPTTEPPLDRQGELKKGNAKRVFKNELKGLGMAIAIGIGVGFTMSFVIEGMARGFDSENIMQVFDNSLKTGLDAGVMSAVTYSSGRIATELINHANVDIATKIGGLVHMGVVGTLTIVAVSAMQFAKLRMNGESIASAGEQVIKQASFSMSVLVVSIIAQGIWGGYSGIIVSSSIGLLYMLTTTVVSQKEKKLSEALHVYTIEQHKPMLLI